MEISFPRPLAVVLLLSSAFCVGCASNDEGTLHLASFNNNEVFSQQFAQAYVTHTDTGDVDIVMVSDGMDSARKDDPSKPLTPIASDAPRQYVHIRVFWKPLAHRADYQANTNAAIQWCLLGDGPNEGSLLEYDGSGLVMLDDDGDTTTVTIAAAWMKAQSKCGDMCDPLGPSTLNGKIKAIDDPNRANQLMAEMKSAARIVQAEASPTHEPAHLSINP
jgi:hypothetical protein